jgi:catechol 2,3-dioxygenase-like lactoylglutathione lyase family enzyme
LKAHTRNSKARSLQPRPLRVNGLYCRGGKQYPHGLMTSAILLLTAATFFTVPTQPPCTGSASAPALDHVIIVVRDLDVAADRFAKLGFRLKPGRLHANNLLNRHVKFRDGSGIELMTVQGEPGDQMARNYVDLLAAGEGGVYVALTASDLAPARKAADALKVPTRNSSSGPWSFLSFPGSAAAAFFLSSGGTPFRDPEPIVSHQPDVNGLAEAWVEGDATVARLLERLGARACGSATARDGRTGERWMLSRGAVVIVPPQGTARPRVLGVVLEPRGQRAREIIRPHPAVWVER